MKILRRLPARALLSFCLVCGLAPPSPPVWAADTARQNPAAAPDPAAAYKEVDLKDLVAKSRTNLPGQRIILAPSPIRFRAVLGALPVAQKSDYLLTALGMMKVGDPPKVSQRIGLDYGGDRLLSAYIEEGAAKRLAERIRPGQAQTFYAFHVYNYARGPALLVISFSD
jgi:hypothetical protein